LFELSEFVVMCVRFVLDSYILRLCIMPHLWPCCGIARLQVKGSVKEPNMLHNYETEKITRKASDVAENQQLCRIVLFFCPRSLCTTHLMLFSEHPPIYA